MIVITARYGPTEHLVVCTSLLKRLCECHWSIVTEEWLRVRENRNGLLTDSTTLFHGMWYQGYERKEEADTWREERSMNDEVPKARYRDSGTGRID